MMMTKFLSQIVAEAVSIKAKGLFLDYNCNADEDIAGKVGFVRILAKSWIRAAKLCITFLCIEYKSLDSEVPLQSASPAVDMVCWLYNECLWL